MEKNLNHSQKASLVAYLTSFITEERKQRFDEVFAGRSPHLSIVLEEVFQSHNASAVLRSADCFGIQYVHFIQERNRYSISGEVAMGSSQWLSITRQNNVAETASQLRREGYKLVATCPGKSTSDPFTLDLQSKTALLFGTEKSGLSPELLGLADAFVSIPTYGFTESLNISVAAAILMQILSGRIKNEFPGKFDFTEEESIEIRLQWLKHSIKRPELIIKEFVARF